MEKQKHHRSTWFESIKPWLWTTALTMATSFIVIFVVGFILFFTSIPSPNSP